MRELLVKSSSDQQCFPTPFLPPFNLYSLIDQVIHHQTMHHPIALFYSTHSKTPQRTTNTLFTHIHSHTHTHTLSLSLSSSLCIFNSHQINCLPNSTSFKPQHSHVQSTFLTNINHPTHPNIHSSPKTNNNPPPKMDPHRPHSRQEITPLKKYPEYPAPISVEETLEAGMNGVPKIDGIEMVAVAGVGKSNGGVEEGGEKDTSDSQAEK